MCILRTLESDPMVEMSNHEEMSKRIFEEQRTLGQQHSGLDRTEQNVRQDMDCGSMSLDQIL